MLSILPSAYAAPSSPANLPPPAFVSQPTSQEAKEAVAPGTGGVGRASHRLAKRLAQPGRTRGKAGGKDGAALRLEGERERASARLSGAGGKEGGASLEREVGGRNLSLIHI